MACTHEPLAGTVRSTYCQFMKSACVYLSYVSNVPLIITENTAKAQTGCVRVGKVWRILESKKHFKVVGEL